jgi:hypothetical protein
MKPRTPAEVIALTKKIILEAAKEYDVRPNEVTRGRFAAVSAGRLERSSIEKLGLNYTGLRDQLFPAPKKQNFSEVRKVIERLIANAK